jgi:hypothetical protein
MRNLDLLVTLWPSFPHFADFAKDPRIAGVRLNSAMVDGPEIMKELELIRLNHYRTPLYFDVKGRQPRVDEVYLNDDFLDITLNHPIQVQTPTLVMFKAETDSAELARLEEGGRRLIFNGGPQFMVKPGESLHIRHPSFKILTPESVFTDKEVKKIELVKQAGFKRFFLSYVESQADVDQFLELVGRDSEVWLKIETEAGLRFVEREFKKRPNLTLVAARGDLYVEIDQPHNILPALKLIISKDPEACVASRLLLSVVNSPVPECSDFTELAWLYDIGYRRMMLCDEICLKGHLLDTAVNVFDTFRSTYVADAVSQAQAVANNGHRGRFPFSRLLSNWRQSQRL